MSVSLARSLHNFSSLLAHQEETQYSLFQSQNISGIIIRHLQRLQFNANWRDNENKFKVLIMFTLLFKINLIEISIFRNNYIRFCKST